MLEDVINRKHLQVVLVQDVQAEKERYFSTDDVYANSHNPAWSENVDLHGS